MLERNCHWGSAPRPPSGETRFNLRQYDGEIGMTAISQNFFVGRFEITLFSQNADE
jgi:hypothetical protein